ncbi:hypothetical protein JCM8097_000565 [Rhodosporidiobolus ruineniae]
MHCSACTRSDRAFYCPNCIQLRLEEHHARRQQLRNALTLVTAKAAAVLDGTGSGGAAAGGFGVSEERKLKAEKWTLASKVLATREAVGQDKKDIAEAEQDLSTRRTALAARRANLSTARSLLSALSPSTSSSSSSDNLPPPPGSSSLPLSLPALSQQLDTLRASLAQQSLESTRVRHILAVELLAVFALRPEEPVLADPFSPVPESSSTFPPPGAFPSTTAPSGPSTPFHLTYTLSTLPLPPLSLLPTLPISTLEALLAQLAHLVRLLALYGGVALPFQPVMGAFGPGRAGVRAVAGIAPSWKAEEEAEDDGRSSGSTTPTQRDRTAAKEAAPAKAAVGVDCWPLCFGSSSSSTSSGGRSRSSKSGASSTAASSAYGDGSGELIGGEGDLASDGDDALSSASSTRTTVTVKSASSRRGGGAEKDRSGGEKKGAVPSRKRTKAVLAGAVALAVDLAWIAWAREEREREMAREGEEKAPRREWKEEDLEDLGGLIYLAAGVANPAGGLTPSPAPPPPASADPLPDPFHNPDPLPPTSSASSSGFASSSTSRATRDYPLPQPSPSAFPLSFPSLVRRYTHLAFSTPSGESTVLLGTPGRKRSGRGKARAGGEADGEDDDEWDFV